MQIHQRAGRDSAYDLFIDVPDKEGVILEILQLLQGISLVNIHINEENREDIHGILQLTFKNAEDQERAQDIDQPGDVLYCPCSLGLKKDLHQNACFILGILKEKQYNRSILSVKEPRKWQIFMM